MEVKVLGPGCASCANCYKLEKVVKEALARLILPLEAKNGFLIL